MNPEARRFFDILDCWHKTEFFIPFALDSVTENLGDNQLAFYVSRETPIAPTDVPLPQNMSLVGGDLFLGTFDKDDVKQIVDQLGGETEFEALDRQERGDEDLSKAKSAIEPNTCFARIKLGSSGELQLQSLEVSTLPWAIGHALNGDLGHLTWQAFESGKLRLAEQLFNFEMSRRKQHGFKNADDIVPLYASDVEPLLAVFCDWANYWPSQELPLALLRLRYKEVKTASDETKQAIGLDDYLHKDSADTNVSSTDAGNSCEEDADERNALPEIGILNSFYLNDLELAMKQVIEGHVPYTLRSYLTPLREEDQVNIATDTGRSHIIEMLQPDRINLGRWPTDPGHSMSLMQQFSINAAFNKLQDGGVFSVNGPPGTGKTTLLRDVIAENIVRRARVLAAFRRPEEAFVSRSQVTVGDETYDIGNLHSDLIGYEMVVASSNNTAVENISQDLPKAASVFRSEGEEFQYLQAVAHKLAAEWVDKKGKTHFRALDPQTMPWGLIACALGNSRNRKNFRDRVLGKNLSDDVRPTWSGKVRPRTLWQWRHLHDETEARESFVKTQEAYLAIEQQVLHRQEELQTFSKLHQDALERRLEKQIENLDQQARSAKASVNIADRQVLKAKTALTGLEAELLELKEVQSQIERLRPSVFERLFRRRRKRDYDQQCRENAAVQIGVRKQITRLRQQMRDDLESKKIKTQTECTDIQTALNVASENLRARDTRLVELAAIFPDAQLLETTQDIDHADVQRSGLNRAGFAGGRLV